MPRWRGKGARNAIARQGSETPFANTLFPDVGSGISSEGIDHACDPFFLTKDVGQGFGLGLNMNSDFAKQWGGNVEIDNVFGRGASVKIYMPVAEDTELDLGGEGGPGPLFVSSLILISLSYTVSHFDHENAWIPLEQRMGRKISGLTT